MKVDDVLAAAYTVPTDFPESDGTYAWKHTTLVLVEAAAGGKTGLGYSYADPATAGPSQLHLTFLTAGGDELAVTTVSVVALAPDGRRLPLQARRFGRGHFVAGTRLAPGVWRFHVDATTGDSRRLSIEARQAVTAA